MTTYSSVPPLLTDIVHVTGSPGHLRLDLGFSTGMARGSGSIFITDGAAQSVIDRATGLPTMRIVGATVTREVPVGSVTIDGNHVYIDGLDLPGGHSYSVLMGPGVLLSSSQFPFAGLSNPGRTSFTVSNTDTMPPSIVSTLFTPALNAANSGTMSITFSESVPTLDAAAFTTPNAVITNLHPVDASRTTWQATVTAAANVQGTSNVASLDMTQVKDAALNAGTGVANVGTYLSDSVLPTLPKVAFSGISPVMSKTGASATLTFSEAVNLTVEALSATYANITSLTTLDGGVNWTVGLSPMSGTTQTGNLQINLGRVQDMAGNFGAGIATSGAYSVDTQGPSVSSIALDGTAINPTHSVTLTITFSEAVKNPAAAITTPHANLTSLHSDDGGVTWVATLTPASSDTGNNFVNIDAANVQDVYGNAGMGTVTSTTGYSVDANTAPVGHATVALSGSKLVWGGSIGVTIGFEVAVSSIDADAISAQNATVENLHASADGKTWYATLKPAAGGTLEATNTVSLNLAKVHPADASAFSGTAVSTGYAVDTTVTTLLSPDLVIDDTGPDAHDYITHDAQTLVGGHFVGTLGADQSVQLRIDGVAIAQDQISIERGATSSWSYKVSTPLSDGSHVIEANVIDTNGHASATMSRTITVETTAPVPALVAPVEGTLYDPGLPLVITFNEKMYWHASTTEYRDDQVVLEGADGREVFVTISASNLSADGKTLTIGAADAKLVSGLGYTLYLPGTLTDIAGNMAADHPLEFHTSGVYVDTLAPHATRAWLFTGSHDSYGAGSTIHIGVTFSEPMKLAEGATPSLGLSSNGQAKLLALTEGGTYAVFEYTVGASDVNGELKLSSTANLVTGLTDLAGNALVASNIDFTQFDLLGGTAVIDTVAPAAPGKPTLDPADDTGTAGDNITSKTIVTLHGDKAEPGNEIDLYDGEYWLTSTAADASGNWSITTSLTVGMHNLVARQIDDAHNESPSSWLELTIVSSGIAKPPAPALATVSDSGVHGDAITNIASPTISGTGSLPNAKIELFDGTTRVGSATANADGVWSLALSNLTEGMHDLAVRQTDGANNTSALSEALALNIDLSAERPNAPVLNSATDSGTVGDNLTNATNPILMGMGCEQGAKVELFDGTTSVAAAVADEMGDWTITLASITEGLHNFTVRQTDLAGNVSVASDVLALTIDRTAPAALTGLALSASSDSGVSNTDHITNVKKPVITGGGAVPGMRVDLYDGAEKVGTGTADGSGNFSIAPSGELLDGSHALSARQLDAAGNASVASASVAVTIDATAPTVASWTSSVTGSGFQLVFSELVDHGALGTGTLWDNSNNASDAHANDPSNWGTTMLNNHEVSVLTLHPSKSGKLSLDLSGVTDAAGNHVAATTIDFPFDVITAQIYLGPSVLY
ncbi:Ig-like domain-containing protein [Massilia agilis]|uniref:Ig-like domain-containing protein n=1 Tax=Massilia agilis TaxID=1811226 RepID=A0ABT2DHJ2_9BURK|nr:Ig-like domain-containing protein [Massilia agilis]MCS0810727.1 Ig-like domain-containing protein [Massilia agilis]